jgi:Protein of unknown function (DUF2786)
METTNERLKDIIRKVQALVRKADDPAATPQEAESFRMGAEALMLKYRIEESQLTAEEKVAAGIAVVWEMFPVCAVDSEFVSTYRGIANTIVSHFEIRGVHRLQNIDGVPMHVIEVVGYESDLQFFELLFTEAAMTFGKRLEPKYDSKLSDQVNAYLMRSAGMEGHRIAMAIYGKDDKHLRPKVRKMFETEALLRGEDPKPLLGRGMNVKQYRRSYAEGFDYEFYSRLSRAKFAAAQQETGLVLASRKDQINEAYYERFPMYRPQAAPSGSLHSVGFVSHENCPKCKAAKSGYCRDHGYLKPSTRLYTDRTNHTALRRGRAAAHEVNLGMGKPEIGER